MRKKSIREYDLWTCEKCVYSFARGLLKRQLSTRPKSVIYCFNVSVECQFLGLLVLSISGLITVLKSPPIKMVEFEWLLIVEKNE